PVLRPRLSSLLLAVRRGRRLREHHPGSASPCLPGDDAPDPRGDAVHARAPVSGQPPRGRGLADPVLRSGADVPADHGPGPAGVADPALGAEHPAGDRRGLVDRRPDLPGRDPHVWQAADLSRDPALGPAFLTGWQRYVGPQLAPRVDIP